MAAGDEMAERTVPLLRRPWPVLPDHHPDPVVTTHASVRHGSGRVHLRAQRHQARRRYGRRRCDDALAWPLGPRGSDAARAADDDPGERGPARGFHLAGPTEAIIPETVDLNRVEASL